MAVRLTTFETIVDAYFWVDGIKFYCSVVHQHQTKQHQKDSTMSDAVIICALKQSGLPEHLVIKVLEYLWTWEEDGDYLDGNVENVKASQSTTGGAEELLFLGDRDPYNINLSI